MRFTGDNHSFSATSASRRRARLVKQGIGLAAVVTAGLLMSIASRLFEADMARGGLVLFGYGCYVFGVRALFQSRRFSAQEREEAIQRLTESQDEWLDSPVEGESRQLSSLARAVGSSTEVTLPTQMWHSERELVSAGGRR